MIQDLSGSWCIKRADESILAMDSSVSSMHHDPDRSWNTDPDPDHPKEHSLNQDNILSHLAKSDGNIRILLAINAYEMRVYSQGVKGPLWFFKNIEAYHYKKGREGSNTPYLWVPVTFMLMYCSDNQESTCHTMPREGLLLHFDADLRHLKKP